MRYSTYLHPVHQVNDIPKRALYLGIKVFNHLPSNIKNLPQGEKQFRLALKRFVLMNYFIHWVDIFIGKCLKMLVPCKYILE
jgi:hypothetical protein